MGVIDLLLFMYWLGACTSTELLFSSPGRLRLQYSSTDTTVHVQFLNNDESVKTRGYFRGIGSFTSIRSQSSDELTCSLDFRNCNNDAVEVIGEQGKFSISINDEKDINCETFVSETDDDQIEFCVPVSDGPHWYGSGEQYYQPWPLETRLRADSAHLPGDMLQSKEMYYGGVVENYWVTSRGDVFHFDEAQPLFHEITDLYVCWRTRFEEPYHPTEKLNMSMTVCHGDNVRDAHQQAFPKWFGKPKGRPDEGMMTFPLWSTWARYKTEINQSLVLQYASEITAHGFLNSHLEIDDDWETCYGDLRFNPVKFPNVSSMVQDLNNMGYRTTLWVHPFTNQWCPTFTEGDENAYFVQKPGGGTALTWWWQGLIAGYLDVTNREAIDWWLGRLRTLLDETGIDNYKIDAGETNWLPRNYDLNADNSTVPQIFTTKYAQMAQELSGTSGLLEARVGRRSQDLSIFVRMLDKESNWGFDNGISTMVTTLLFMNLVGYPFVLPDMIGGNGYQGAPSKELFIRWLQVNVFMPSIQFSYVPWDYDQETVEISKEMVNLHTTFAPYIIQLAQQAVETGAPINRPLWWLDPTDETALTCNDEFLLGDAILVAPVLEQGATSRDIYLPVGTWTDMIVQTPERPKYTGPVWLRNYSAPLNVLPFFTNNDYYPF